MSPYRALQPLTTCPLNHALWWLLVLICGCQAKDAPRSLREELNQLSEQVQAETAESTFDPPAEVRQFCGNCHLVPMPASFTREAWYDEIHKGYEFYARSGRTDLVPPKPASVVELYRTAAPRTFDFRSSPEIDRSWVERFQVESISWRDGPRLSPAVSSIQWIQANQVQAAYLLVTDMRDGSINRIVPQPQRSTRQLLGRTKHPARATIGDIDEDGQPDILIADLGSFSPYDHQLGSVCWLKPVDNGSTSEPIVLASGLGRVADVAIADFVGDERNELLVAEFGHRQTGGVHLLARADKESGELTYADQVLDIRPGTIRLLPHDWNNDGRLDFASLVSQEFECVDLFINGDRKFDRHRAAAGTDLTFGSVALDSSDIDRDGDLDLLYVNGDSFDNNFANRSHGIQLLENLGNLKFQAHRLIELPGAYCAKAGDVNGDGLQDIVAVANLPTIVYPENLIEQNPAALVVLEQTDGLQFKPHVLARSDARYPALEVADFNGDGKLDIAVGTQLFDTDPPDSSAARLPHLAIWWQK